MRARESLHTIMSRLSLPSERQTHYRKTIAGLEDVWLLYDHNLTWKDAVTDIITII